jgi:hypothetical protein
LGETVESEVINVNSEQFIASLENNPFAVLNLDGEERGSFGHHFTVGLSRFGRSELYIHFDDEEKCQELLMDLGDRHMTKMLENGLLTLPGYTAENGDPLLFTVRYLSGAELFAAIEEFNAGFEMVFGAQYESIYAHGICQIYWPDDDNLSVQMLKEITKDKRADQDITPVIIH